jgi:hypothetical protein
MHGGMERLVDAHGCAPAALRDRATEHPRGAP